MKLALNPSPTDPFPMKARALASRFRSLVSLGLGTLGLLCLAACSIPIPQAENDPTRFYVLSTTAAPAPAAGAPAVHLRPVELASYLRSRPIIVRQGNNEIQFREFARWGESLELGIGRVLREELLARGAVSAVGVTGLRASAVKYDHELTVRILAFEGTADGGVNFRAGWELATTGPSAATVARGDYRPTDLKWSGKNEGELAAQLSTALAGLATEISAALKK